MLRKDVQLYRSNFGGYRAKSLVDRKIFSLVAVDL